jgi:hypothetical protein
MKEKKMNRRTFLRTQALSTLAMGGMVSALGRSKEKKEQPAEKILNYQPEMTYRQIGNSGIWLSLLSLGGLDVVPQVHDYAIEKGVNFVHISTGYKGGTSIRNLAKVLKHKRDKVYVAVKDNFSNIDEVLGLLGIETIDFLMFNRHRSNAVNDERISEEFMPVSPHTARFRSAPVSVSNPDSMPPSCLRSANRVGMKCKKSWTWLFAKMSALSP